MTEPLIFPVDEVKEGVIWQKGSDFMDGSPRYTFEGRDPATTAERFQVVIYTVREREHEGLVGSPWRRYYYGYVRDNDKECADTIGRFRTLVEAKEKTLQLFNLFMKEYLEGQGGQYETDR